MSIIPIAIGLGGLVFSGASTSAPSAANLPLGTKAFFSDIGINGSEMVVSASGTWVPHNGRTLLSRLTLPLVKAPTFTGTTNGAITLGTATGSIYAKCYMYFPANSLVASHAAGWYYTEMSGTSAGIVYNNTYTPSAGVLPTEPISKTAFSGAVPGGAGSTAKITALVVSLKGGSIGIYGGVISDIGIENNNNANGKRIDVDLSASNVGFLSVDASLSTTGIGSFRNIGSMSRQRSRLSYNLGASSAAESVSSVDTSVDTEITYSLRTASAATDFIALTKLFVSMENA